MTKLLLEQKAFVSIFILMKYNLLFFTLGVTSKDFSPRY